MSEPLSSDVVLQARAEVSKIESQWKPFYEGSPEKSGYYFVRDCSGRDGVAFMYRNRQWKAIDGQITKPFSKWREMT